MASSIAGALLTPAALMALALGCWRLAADLSWAGEFAIPTGLFSHWQVWFLVAAVLQVVAATFNRLGHGAVLRRLPSGPVEEEAAQEPASILGPLERQ